MRIYYKGSRLEPDLKSGDKIMRLDFECGAEEFSWKVVWEVVDQLYVFRHFVQQVNMLSKLKDMIEGDGNIRELFEELSNALKNTMKETNKAQELSKELEEFKSGAKIVQTPELRKELQRIFILSFLKEGIEEGELYEEYLEMAQWLEFFDKHFRKERRTRREAVLIFLRMWEITEQIGGAEKLNDEQQNRLESEVAKLVKEEVKGKRVEVDWEEFWSRVIYGEKSWREMGDGKLGKDAAE